MLCLQDGVLLCKSCVGGLQGNAAAQHHTIQVGGRVSCAVFVCLNSGALSAWHCVAMTDSMRVHEAQHRCLFLCKPEITTLQSHDMQAAYQGEVLLRGFSLSEQSVLL